VTGCQIPYIFLIGPNQLETTVIGYEIHRALMKKKLIFLLFFGQPETCGFPGEGFFSLMGKGTNY